MLPIGTRKAKGTIVYDIQHQQEILFQGYIFHTSICRGKGMEEIRIPEELVRTQPRKDELTLEEEFVLAWNTVGTNKALAPTPIQRIIHWIRLDTSI